MGDQGAQALDVGGDRRDAEGQRRRQGPRRPTGPATAGRRRRARSRTAGRRPGCPANVTRSAILRRSARRRRSTSSSPWPAITNSASTPASITCRAAFRNVANPEAATSGPAVPITGTPTGPSGATLGGSSSGTSIPGFTTAIQPAGSPSWLDQVVGQLAAGRDQAAAPAAGSAGAGRPAGTNSSIVWT